MALSTPPLNERLASRAGGDRFGTWFDRWWRPIWGLLLAAIAVGAAGKAAERLLWHDELFTLYGASFTMSELWQALASGYDLQPPLGYLLTGLSVSAFGDGLVPARLPSLAGFLLGSLALALFVRREAGTVAATIALLVPSVTAAYDYAYEARPYGVVFGAAGLVILAWQRSVPGRWRTPATTALALALAAAVSLHYYAALLVLPLAAAEATRSTSTGRWQPGVWLAIAAGLSPLLAYLPFISAASAYGDRFWTQASLAQVPYTYRYFLLPVVLPFAGFLLAYAVCSLVRGGTSAPGYPRSPAASLVLSIALLLLPFAGVAAGFVVGGYRHRYVIEMVLGLGSVIAIGLAPSALASRVLMAVLSVWLVGRGVGHAAPLLAPPPELLARHPMLRLALAEPDIPIVVINDALYTQLNHYGTPDLTRRLMIVMPPADPVVGRFQNSSERAMRALARWRSISLAEYDELRARSTPYYIYGDKHWLLVQIRHDGARAEMLGEGYGHTLLRVTPRAEAEVR
jgi:hypothetical protein